MEIVNSTAFGVNITTEELEVTVAGLSDTVESIKASDISAVLKVDDDIKAGKNQKLEISVKVNNQNDKWVIGTYSVTADVTQ